MMSAAASRHDKESSGARVKISIKNVGMGRPRVWLSSGFEDFRAATAVSLSYGMFWVGLSIAVTARLAAGESPIIEAALVKDLGTSFEQELPIMIADALSADPDLQPPASLMETSVFVGLAAPSYSLRGGTREILRGMIARGLGLR